MNKPPGVFKCAKMTEQKKKTKKKTTPKTKTHQFLIYSVICRCWFVYSCLKKQRYWTFFLLVFFSKITPNSKHYLVTNLQWVFNFYTSTRHHSLISQTLLILSSTSLCLFASFVPFVKFISFLKIKFIFAYTLNLS